MKKIVIDAEFRSLIPPLRPDELEGLGASLQSEGCRDPLVVWGSKGILLDGHNRLDICKAHGFPYTVVGLEFDGRDEAKLWIEQNQLNRRNLTDDQRAAIAYRIGERRSQGEKRERAKKGGKAGGRHHPKVSLSDNVSDKLKPKPKAKANPKAKAKTKAKADTRATVAGQARVPERKVRDIAAARKAVEEVLGEGAGEELVRKIQDGKVTVRQAKAEAKRALREAKKQAELDTRARMAADRDGDGDRGWEVHQGDCVEWLGRAEPGSARLVFADPPYNIGVDYGPHYDDSRDDDEFAAWCFGWIEASRRVLSPDGSLWVLAPHDLAASLWLHGARQAGFHLAQWIIWYQTFGVNTARQFNLCSRTLLWLVMDPKAFVFNDHAPEIRRASDRQEKYHDSRASPDGKLWDDVWGVTPPVPRLVGTGGERMPKFPTQLPISLLGPIVACASDPGDLVVDLFSGSGTTGAACIALGRRFVGVELSPEFADLSRKRLSGCTREAEA